MSQSITGRKEFSFKSKSLLAKFEIDSLDGLEEISRYLHGFFLQNKIFLLDAEMGCGKTTLMRSIGKLLGFEHEVSSPTFSLINQYIGTNGLIIYHMDLYRIEFPIELVQLGIEEYLLSGDICFIEWPSIALDLIPEAILIEIKQFNLVNRVFEIYEVLV